jgi:Domain of unknown function (DUF4105)
MRARAAVSAIFPVSASALAIAPLSAWTAAAFWFRLPLPEWARAAVCCLVALCALATIVALFTRARWRGLLLFALAFAGVILWWGSIRPAADGDWAPDVARQTTGALDGDILTLSDVRDFDWKSEAAFTERWRARSYDLSKLESLDLFLSYWAGPEMAHLIMSFGFEGGDELAWSIEVRREKNGQYSPVADAFKTHTVVYLATTERDSVRLRSNVRGEDVRLYRLQASPAAARALLLQYVAEANALKERPAFYNSITTNCTTAVAKLIWAAGGALPLDWRLVVNGYLPGYLYDRRAVVTEIPLSELMALARIDPRARAADQSPDFSKLIRVGVPSPNDQMAR